MQQALTREIRTLKGPDQIKDSSNLSQLPEVNHTPGVKITPEANPEVVASMLIQEIMKGADHATGMTDPNLKTDLSPKSGVVSDVEKPITNRRTATSRRKLV